MIEPGPEREFLRFQPCRDWGGRLIKRQSQRVRLPPLAFANSELDFSRAQCRHSFFPRLYLKPNQFEKLLGWIHQLPQLLQSFEDIVYLYFEIVQYLKNVKYNNGDTYVCRVLQVFKIIFRVQCHLKYLLFKTRLFPKMGLKSQKCTCSSNTCKAWHCILEHDMRILIDHQWYSYSGFQPKLPS